MLIIYNLSSVQQKQSQLHLSTSFSFVRQVSLPLLQGQILGETPSITTVLFGALLMGKAN